MEPKTIILQLDNISILLNGVLHLKYENTNLPKEYFKFPNDKLIYFEAKIEQYDIASGYLKISIVNYIASPPKIKFLPEQYLSIKLIEFSKMDWLQFSRQIYTYTLSKIRHLFHATELDNYAKTENLNTFSLVNQSNSTQDTSLDPNLKNIEFISHSLIVKYENAIFCNGHVSFNINLKKYNINTKLEIENPIIKQEFESIKPWFIKKLGKSFTAVITIMKNNGLIQEVTAVSSDISKINEDLIEKIKRHRVQQLVKSITSPQEGKSIFTSSELFSLLGKENMGTDTLNPSPSNMLKILIETGEAKNTKQLDYLSGDKQSLNERLRFTTTPHFGFLFYVKTQKGQYFVWELLISHATYIWITDLQNPSFLSIVEKEISFIQLYGREVYKHRYKTQNPKDYNFRIIEHKGSNLNEEERFKIWKNWADKIIS